MNKRIQRELTDFINNPPPGWSGGLTDSMEQDRWQLAFTGPEDSPYCGGLFLLNLKFPENYPFRAPQVSFSTRIYHPNVNSSGDISFHLLCCYWVPTKTVKDICKGLAELIVKPDVDEPLVPEIACLYLKDREKYDKLAKEWTKKYAM